MVAALVSLPVTVQATESFFNTTEDERTTIDRFKHCVSHPVPWTQVCLMRRA